MKYEIFRSILKNRYTREIKEFAGFVGSNLFKNFD